MPVIREEDDSLGAPPVDFSDLLNIPVTPLDTSNDILGDAAGLDPSRAEYDMTLSHPFTMQRVLTYWCSYLANDFLGDWDLPQPTNQPFAGLEEPDYGKFENVGHLHPPLRTLTN